MLRTTIAPKTPLTSSLTVPSPPQPYILSFSPPAVLFMQSSRAYLPQSFGPFVKYSNEIRSAVLIVHGEKAHSYYFGKDAYENMIKNSKYTSNKELLTIPGAVHTDLYDNPDVIPFDKIQKFFKENGVG